MKAQPQLAPNAANDISGAIRRDKMSQRKVETVEAGRAEPREEQRVAGRLGRHRLLSTLHQAGVILAQSHW